MSADNKNGNMVVTPFEVKGDIDYNKLIERFGTQPMTEELKERIAKQAGFMHMQLRRRRILQPQGPRLVAEPVRRGTPGRPLHGPRPLGRRPPRPPTAVVLLRLPPEGVQRRALLPDDRRREIPPQGGPDTRRDHRLLLR